jgi:hypothetical protein
MAKSHPTTVSDADILSIAIGPVLKMEREYPSWYVSLEVADWIVHTSVVFGGAK